MTQTQIIFALIKKNQVARKEYFEALDAQKTQTKIIGLDEINRLETVWTEWAVALEKLSIVLGEDANETQNYEEVKRRRLNEERQS